MLQYRPIGQGLSSLLTCLLCFGELQINLYIIDLFKALLMIKLFCVETFSFHNDSLIIAVIPSLQLKSALLKDKQINDFVILFQLANTILSSFLQTNLSESEKLGLLSVPAFEFVIDAK